MLNVEWSMLNDTEQDLRKRRFGFRFGRAVRAGSVAMLLLAAVGRVSGEVIDRLMAVVMAQPILLSDVNAALLFRLVPLEPNVADPVAAVLDRLIERTLMLAEVDRYQPPEPAAQEIDARLTESQRRFGSSDALDKALAATGMTRDLLRQYIRDDLRIAIYLNQRFGSAAEPSEADVLAYYREHQAEFMSGGKLLPYEAAADVIRLRLGQVRRETLIQEWLATLRRRAEVRVLYLGK